MSEKDKLKSQVYLIIFIFIFLMIVVTGVYAYYITKDFKYGSFDVEVKTKGVDTLKIKSGNDININANDHNFIKDVFSLLKIIINNFFILFNYENIIFRHRFD